MPRSGRNPKKETSPSLAWLTSLAPRNHLSTYPTLEAIQMECPIERAHKLASQRLPALLAYPLSSTCCSSIPSSRPIPFLALVPVAVWGKGRSPAVARTWIGAWWAIGRVAGSRVVGGEAPLWCSPPWIAFGNGRRGPRGPSIIVRPQHSGPLDVVLSE